MASCYEALMSLEDGFRWQLLLLRYGLFDLGGEGLFDLGGGGEESFLRTFSFFWKSSVNLR